MNYDFKVNIIRNHAIVGTLQARRCNIIFDSSKEVMRVCRLQIKENGEQINKGIVKEGDAFKYVSPLPFNMFSDRIQPIMIQDGVEYPLGLFMVISNPKTISNLGNYYDLECYDETMILKQACTVDRIFYAQGTPYMQIINSLLAETKFVNIIADANTDTLNVDREFAVGESYLSIINQLLGEINFTPIYSDAYGNLHMHFAQSKTQADFIYSDKNVFNTKRPISNNTDIYDLPNVLIGTASNPDTSDVYYSKKENNDVNSQISIINRGYKVVKHFNFGNVASQAVLDEYIERMYVESTQAVETIQFDSRIEPMHEYESLLLLDTDLIDGYFVEKQWELELSSRASMHHIAERRVFV